VTAVIAAVVLVEKLVGHEGWVREIDVSDTRRSRPGARVHLSTHHPVSRGADIVVMEKIGRNDLGRVRVLDFQSKIPNGNHRREGDGPAECFSKHEGLLTPTKNRYSEGRFVRRETAVFAKAGSVGLSGPRRRGSFRFVGLQRYSG
jgi:hypothetical protein